MFKILICGPVSSGKYTTLYWISKGFPVKLKRDESGVINVIFENVVKRVSNIAMQCMAIDDRKLEKLQRKTLYIGSDAILFVWDSHPDKWEDNIWSFNELMQFYGSKMLLDKKGKVEVPLVMCANKRDIPIVTSVEKIKKVLTAAGLENTVIYETIALTGVNIKRAFFYCAREAVLKHYLNLKEVGSDSENRTPRSNDQVEKSEEKINEDLVLSDDFSEFSENWDLVYDPYNPKVWKNKGDLYYKSSKYQKAIDCYEKALELDPELEDVWIKKGYSLFMKKNYQGAIICYEASINLNKENTIAWRNKGSAHDRLEEFEEAIHCFEIALELDPSDALAWNNLGSTLFRSEKFQEAADSYDHALELNPKFKSAILMNKNRSLTKLRGEQLDDENLHEIAQELGEEKAFREEDTVFEDEVRTEEEILDEIQIMEQEIDELTNWIEKFDEKQLQMVEEVKEFEIQLKAEESFIEPDFAWICENCGKKNLKPDDFCADCALPPPNTPKDWYCQDCGNRNSGSITICEKCGKSKR